jgi:hypothetical protein
VRRFDMHAEVVFSANTRAIAGASDEPGTEKALKRAFDKWLKAQGLVIVTSDVIEMSERAK